MTVKVSDCLNYNNAFKHKVQCELKDYIQTEFLTALKQLLYELSQETFVTSLSTALLLCWLPAVTEAELFLSSKVAFLKFFRETLFWSCCFDTSEISIPNPLDGQAAARARVIRAVGSPMAAAVTRFWFFISQA